MIVAPSFRGEPGKYDVMPLAGAATVEAAEWNGLATRGFQLHHWFVAAQRSGWIERHVAVRTGQRLSSVVPAYLTGSHTTNDLHDRWLGPLRGTAARMGWTLRPVISVQAPYALVSEPIGTQVSTDLLHQVMETLEIMAAEDRAMAVAWPCVDAECSRLIQVARDRGYAVMYAGASARISVRWTSFEEFVGSRSKSVRRTIKADLRQLQRGHLRTESATDFRSAVPAMNALYQDAFRRRTGRDSASLGGFLEQLSMNPSSAIRAQLTWNGAELIGASLNLATPRMLDGTLAAFTRSHQGGAAYYNDLCYDPIRFACREGIAAIDLGATALYPKVLRGAKLRRRFVLVKGMTPAWHRVLVTLGRLVARRTEWKERRSLGSMWKPDLFPDQATN